MVAAAINLLELARTAYEIKMDMKLLFFSLQLIILLVRLLLLCLGGSLTSGPELGGRLLLSSVVGKRFGVGVETWKFVFKTKQSKTH